MLRSTICLYPFIDARKNDKTIRVEFKVYYHLIIAYTKNVNEQKIAFVFNFQSS